MTTYKDPFRFYVYAYLRSKDSATAKAGTPYYIGKGQGNRAYSKHGVLSIPPDKNNIVFLERNLSEIGALALERFYIRWYGKQADYSGILLNIQDGGDGGTNIGGKTTKGKTPVKYIEGNCYLAMCDDPKLLTGEIRHFFSGMMTVRDKFNKTFNVNIHDP